MASFSENFLSENAHHGDISMEDLIPKKIRFREDGEVAKEDAVPDTTFVPNSLGELN